MFSHKGLVQVYHSRTWGWICNQGWDKQDADVVCRELGFTKASMVYGSLKDKGGVIWMKNIQCIGNETSLVLCDHEDGRNIAAQMVNSQVWSAAYLKVGVSYPKNNK